MLTGLGWLVVWHNCRPPRQMSSAFGLGRPAAARPGCPFWTGCASGAGQKATAAPSAERLAPAGARASGCNQLGLGCAARLGTRQPGVSVDSKFFSSHLPINLDILKTGCSFRSV